MILEFDHWPIALALFLLALLLDRKLAPVTLPPEIRPPALAWVNFVIQIAIAIVAAVISAAMAPKPKPPEPQKADVPEVKDGKRIVRLYGACWITEPAQLAMKQIDPPVPIKYKSGK